MGQASITVPNELFAPAESSCFTGSYDLPVLNAGFDLYEFEEPLAWQVIVSNTGDALLVTGTVEGKAKVSCARCLEPFESKLVGEVEGYYLIGEEVTAPEDMDEDEFEVLPKDNTIDLAPLLDAALLLELPLVPLCDEECKGLCPTCGENLNEKPCACDGKPSDTEVARHNPFSVLRDYPLGEGDSSND